MIDPLYVIYKDGELFQTATSQWEAESNVDDNIDCTRDRAKERRRYQIVLYAPLAGSE